MDRNIFSYFNGKTDVRCDPYRLEVRFRRAANRTDFASVMKRFVGPDWLDDPEKTAAQRVPDAGVKLALDEREFATEELIPVLAETFGVKTFDEDPDGGMTWTELLTAYTDWMNFVNGVKKNTDSTPSPADAPTPETLTSGNSGSTSTPTSSPVSNPSPSPGGSPSPSAASPTAPPRTPSRARARRKK